MDGPKAQVFLLEAYRHGKTVAAWGERRPVTALCEAVGWHRHWDR